MNSFLSPYQFVRSRRRFHTLVLMLLLASFASQAREVKKMARNTPASRAPSCGTWTGAVSTDWNMAGNWCGGVPTAATDITIPASATLMPDLRYAFGTARNVTIQSGATLTVGDVGTLEVHGDIINNGSFYTTDGHLSFRGSSPQSLPRVEVQHLTVNGAGGVVLAGDVTIWGGLVLVKGHITLGPHTLSTVTGAAGSLESHIITNGTGHVLLPNLAPNTSRIVPVGADATSYNPVLIIANPGHVTDHFTIDVKHGVFKNGNAGETFTDYVVNRTWHINEQTPGGSSVNLRLYWDASQEMQNFDRQNSYVAQHRNGNWIHGIPTAAQGTGPYSQVRVGLIAFSPFTVRNEPIPQPASGIYPNPAHTHVNVVLQRQEPTPTRFRIYDAAGRLLVEEYGSVNAGTTRSRLDIQGLPAGIYFLHVSTPGERVLLAEKFVKR